MGKNWRRFWVQHIPWSSKILFCFWIEAFFFSNGHIRNVVSTLPNVVKIDVENDNVVWTLSNVIQFNVDVHNIVSMLIWRCATSRRHINLKSTLNWRWNVCLEVSTGSIYIFTFSIAHSSFWCENSNLSVIQCLLGASHFCIKSCHRLAAMMILHPFRYPSLVYITHHSRCEALQRTAWNIVISPNFLVWKFCKNEQFS